MAGLVLPNWTQSVADTNPAEEAVTLYMLTVRHGAVIGTEPSFIYLFISTAWSLDHDIFGRPHFSDFDSVRASSDWH